MENILSAIPGFDEVAKHFGQWPSFHDAILEKLVLNENGVLALSLRTWNISSELDERGDYRLTHQATVDFTVKKLISIELSGSDLYAGSILFGLSISQNDGIYHIELDPCLGISGWILGKEVELALRAE